MSIGVREVLLFMRLSRPIFLLGGFLLYGLGAAIAGYLGRPIDAGSYLIGQILVSSIQLMTHYLNEYYDSGADLQNANRTIFSGGSGVLGDAGLPRKVALYAASIALALAATTASAALVRQAFPPWAWSALLFIFIGAFSYSAPPMRLTHTGYGEIMASVIVAGLLPTFGFMVQTGELHRLLIMSTTPLMALAFAMLIAFGLPDYAADIKAQKRNFVVRMGWLAAMRTHDLAILFAMLSLLLAFVFGLPRRVALGAMITIPLGIAQWWQMRRIRQGFPPRWTSLTLGAVALFAITAYLELIGYVLS